MGGRHGPGGRPRRWTDSGPRGGTVRRADHGPAAAGGGALRPRGGGPAPALPPGPLSPAAYWAARSHLKDRKPEQVSRWLRVAAEHPRTFYGQLARRALGMEAAFDWSGRPVSRPAG